MPCHNDGDVDDDDDDDDVMVVVVVMMMMMMMTVVVVVVVTMCRRSLPRCLWRDRTPLMMPTRRHAGYRCVMRD
jgi:hypothetical protein